MYINSIFKDYANTLIMINNLHVFECSEFVMRRIRGINKRKTYV